MSPIPMPADLPNNVKEAIVAYVEQEKSKEFYNNDTELRLVSAREYEDMKETLEMYSVPGLVESVLEAKKNIKNEWISEEDFEW